MIDTYTKAVLTVIALALVLLTVENLTYQARAQQTACGDYIHPCVVTTENPAESPCQRHIEFDPGLSRSAVSI